MAWFVNTLLLTSHYIWVQNFVFCALAIVQTFFDIFYQVYSYTHKTIHKLNCTLARVFILNTRLFDVRIIHSNQSDHQQNADTANCTFSVQLGLTKMYTNGICDANKIAIFFFFVLRPCICFKRVYTINCLRFIYPKHVECLAIRFLRPTFTRSSSRVNIWARSFLQWSTVTHWLQTPST